MMELPSWKDMSTTQAVVAFSETARAWRPTHGEQPNPESRS